MREVVGLLSFVLVVYLQSGFSRKNRRRHTLKEAL